MNNTINPPIP